MNKKLVPLLLVGLLFFAFLTRVFRLHDPQRYIFDEVYHVVTVKLIAQNDPRAYEWWHPAPEKDTAIDWLHPPLAKLTQAAFVNLLGVSSFSWRFSSAVFGVGVIGLTFILAKNVFQDEKIGLLAAFLAALDGLLLVQSRIAMNDIHVTFFILLALIFYHRFSLNRHQKKWLLLTGLGAGLAMASKWSGIFVLGIVGLMELKDWLSRLKEIMHKPLSDILKELPIYAFSLIILPGMIYLLAYGQMFLQGKGWPHFIGLHQQIWAYQTGLTATHGYQSRPGQWFLNMRPVWFHVVYDENTIANIYAFGNPLLNWLGAAAVIISVLTLSLKKYLAHVISKKSLKQLLKELRPLAFLVIAYLTVWLPWQLSPRIMFYYHYTPAIPLLCIILSYWLMKLWRRQVKSDVNWYQVGVLSAIGLILMTFLIWYPHWTALPVPKSFADQVYFALPQWK